MADNIVIDAALREVIGEAFATRMNISGAAANPLLLIREGSTTLVSVALHDTDCVGAYAAGVMKLIRSTGNWDYAASPVADGTADNAILVDEDGGTVGTLTVGVGAGFGVTLGTTTITTGTSVVFTEANAPQYTIPDGS